MTWLQGLLPAQRLIIYFSASAFAMAAAGLLWSGYRLDWAGHGTMILALLVLATATWFYSAIRPDRRLATTLLATAAVLVFVNSSSILNYTLLALDRPLIDDVLVGWDAAIGFVWPDFVAAMVQWPVLVFILHIGYLSALPQIAILLILLGFCGRTDALHRFVLLLMITAFLTIGMWAAFPSFGAMAYYGLSPELAAELNLAVGPDYGEDLRALAGHQGPVWISPSELKGLIAFPSFHTVLALLSVYGAMAIRALIVPFAVLNVTALAAVPLHGGHHLVDIFAGMVVFVVGLILARRLLATSTRAIGQAVQTNPIGARSLPAQASGSKGR